jgi:catechol 2,3-dioxygenase-like lactoylglutathione lyase family enzyme
MTMPARVTFVTLVVRDLQRMADFFRALGWPESERRGPGHVAFRCGGAVFALAQASLVVEDLGAPPPPGAFKGVVFTVNVDAPDEVDRAFEAVKDVDGALILTEPHDLFLGTRGFTFRDPEDNVWDVIWTEGTTFDDRGGLNYP